MRGIGIWVFVAGLVGSAPARGDSLRGTYDDELTELAHRVTAQRRDRLVHFTVTRVLHNRARRADEARLTFDLPPGAVARGMRVGMSGRWISGKVMESARAETLYDQLTGKGPVRRRGPALLAWRAGGQLSLRVFPVPARGSITVELSLVAPLCYYNGWQVTAYPDEVSTATKLARIRVSGGRVVTAKKATKLLGTDPDDACDGIGVGATSSTQMIMFAAPRRAPFVVRYGRVPVDPKRSLVRLEVDAAASLGARPRKARVIFVVDASFSQGTSGLAAQLEMVRGYLHHVPDARFEVVLYRRRASRLFDTFVKATRVDAALRAARARLTLGNGSNLDEGMALAAQLVQGRSPARIVAFTDSQFARSLQPAGVAWAMRGLRRDVVVHLGDVAPGGGTVTLERNDGHPFAPVIESTGGMVVKLRGGASARDALLELVRPLRIHSFALGKSLPEPMVSGVPDDLAAGVGFRTFALVEEAPARLEVSGKLWGTKLRMTVRPRRADDRSALLVAFGNAVTDKLTPSQQRALGLAARVVSPQTSILARDPRDAPTSWNYRGGISGSSGPCGFSIGSTCGSSTCGGIGHGSYGRMPRIVISTEEVLRDLLAPRASACAKGNQLASYAIDVAVETTSAEIVGVSVTGNSNDGFTRCVAEGVWQLALPPDFAYRRDHRVRLASTN